MIQLTVHVHSPKTSQHLATKQAVSKAIAAVQGFDLDGSGSGGNFFDVFFESSLERIDTEAAVRRIIYSLQPKHTIEHYNLEF